jgi:hypothetical protein
VRLFNCNAKNGACEKRVKSFFFLAVLIPFGWCCSADEFKLPSFPEADDRRSDAEAEDAYISLLDIDASSTELLLTGVVPASGPFVGGNQAVVRGSGFTADSKVFIGGQVVRSQDVTLIDSHRLSIIVPAGEPGPSDVVVERGSESAVLESGYTYHSLFIDPSTGSTAGGTLVEIIGNGTTFSQDAEVLFDSTSCLDVQVLSETRLTCKTPPMPAGSVDVSVTDPESSDNSVIARDAYAYADTANAVNGGLAGSPIDGTINVTVVDSTLGLRLAGAYVVVGNDLDTPLQGLTDARGQITFSSQGLEGPVTIHAALHCFEKGSIVALDATDVTIFLRTLIGIEPSCTDIDLFEFEIPDFPENTVRAVATISGEVILPQLDEFFYNDWNRIPKPRDNEFRVVYIFTTRSSATSSSTSPKTSEGLHRVVEGESEIQTLGYPYKIATRSGGLAVYALAGIEDRSTREFTPYFMGVTRDVVTAPGEETSQIDIFVDIPLDREFSLELIDLPQPTPTGPYQFRAQAHVDIGGQGVIVREVNDNVIDLIRKSSGDTVFRFLAQPAMIDNLVDGRYAVLVGWYTGPSDEPPYTEMIRRGAEQTVDPLILQNELLGLPQAISPKDGERIPEDRMLSWRSDGLQPDMHIVTIEGGDGMPAWRQIIPGSIRETPIPDLSSIPNLEDIAEGYITWKVRAVRIPTFQYNQFQYDQLSSRRWTHEALNAFTMKR